jgi:phospholipid/cholesterol/gamma-HCH transport system substrate-binding protein
MAKMPKLASRIIGIVVVAAIVLGGVYYLFFRNTSNKTVTAQFSFGVGIYSGTPVRILGVNVGEVTDVTPRGKYVYVKMEYDGKYRLAPTPTVGAVEVANSLVSDRYIQLTPLYNAKRDHGKWLPSGARIDNKHTAAPAELDDIYGALDKLSVALGPTGANKPSAPGKNDGALSTLLKVASANLKGNGAAIGNSIHKLAAAARTLATKRGDLFATVRNLQKFSHALADSDGDIRSFNQLLAQVSGDLASERTDLGGALKQLGLALDDVNNFVKNNAGKFHSAISGLEDVTGVLVKEKASLNETLAVGPVALANIVHAYQPNLGVIVSRSNLVSLTGINGKTVCAVLEVVIQQAGGVLSGVLGKITKPLDGVCNGILGGGGPGAIEKAIKHLLGGLGINLPLLGNSLVPQFQDARRLTTSKIGQLITAAVDGGS